ncbi:hypothetical protein PGB90_004262 [Kerria lacca]
MAGLYSLIFFLHIISVFLTLVNSNDNPKNGIISSKWKRSIPQSYIPLNRCPLKKCKFSENKRSISSGKEVPYSVPSKQTKYSDIFANSPKKNIRKREIYNSADEKADGEYFAAQTDRIENIFNEKRPRLKIKENEICFLSDLESDERIICIELLSQFSTRNTSVYDYIIANGKNNEENLFKNQPEKFLENNNKYRQISKKNVRKNQSTFGKSLFSRYDRGRDNFMRLGRSIKKNDDYIMGKTQKYDNFIRLGRSKSNDFFNRLPKKYAKFLRPRIERAVNKFGLRFSRKNDNFLRFGRDYDPRFTRNYDHFIRFGRVPDIKKGNNYIRFGRSNDDYPLVKNAEEDVDNIYDRFLSKEHPFKISEQAQFHDRIQNWIKEMGKRSISIKDSHNEECGGGDCKSGFVKYVNADFDDGLTRMTRKHDNFMRLGRSVNNVCKLQNTDWKLEDVQNLIENENLELIENDTNSLNALMECLKKYSKNSFNDTTVNDENLILFEKATDPDNETNVAEEKFARIARRRGLLLRFGRSNFSTNLNFENQPRSYQNLNSFDEDRNTYNNVHDFNIEKENLL